MFRYLVIGLMVLALALSACSKKESEPQVADTTVVADETPVEFLYFPLPSFSYVFGKLDHLKESDFANALPSTYPPVVNSPYRSPFVLGAMTADAIFAVKGKSPAKLRMLAEQMKEYAKDISDSLSQEVLKFADDLQKQVDAENWPELEKNLDIHKNDITKILYESRDYDPFILLQLGGWTEGLNRSAYLLSLKYDPNKTFIVDEKGILNTLIDNMGKIKNPNIRDKDFYSKSLQNLGRIKDILYTSQDDKLTKEQISEILKLTDEIKVLFK